MLVSNTPPNTVHRNIWTGCTRACSHALRSWRPAVRQQGEHAQAEADNAQLTHAQACEILYAEARTIAICWNPLPHGLRWRSTAGQSSERGRTARVGIQNELAQLLDSNDTGHANSLVFEQLKSPKKEIRLMLNRCLQRVSTWILSWPLGCFKS